MKTFLIREEGQVFARVRARTAEGALRRAAREYPRHAVDYNVSEGERFSIEWHASEAYGTERATARVDVPGDGPPRF